MKSVKTQPFILPDLCIIPGHIPKKVKKKPQNTLKQSRFPINLFYLRRCQLGTSNGPACLSQTQIPQQRSRLYHCFDQRCSPLNNRSSMVKFFWSAHFQDNSSSFWDSYCQRQFLHFCFCASTRKNPAPFRVISNPQ